MVQLPKLMVGEDLPRLVDIFAAITSDPSETVECDAQHLLTAHPVALCLLASAFEQLRRRGQTAIISHLDPVVRMNLERMDVLAQWFTNQDTATSRRHTDGTDPPIHARRVDNVADANEIANALAGAIVAFVPDEDRVGVLEQDPQLMRYLAVEQPIGYLMTELLDNALNHARAGGFAHAKAWVAAQYYPAGDLIRVCVVDDGCGFLRSLQGHAQLTPKTHVSALTKAFEPFVSCKKDVRLFKDSVHQGVGLTVCRDLCLRADGSVDAASGNAWLRNPGTSGAYSRQIPCGYQGSILNLAFHRRALTPGSLGEILRRYQSSEDLPIRFI